MKHSLTAARRRLTLPSAFLIGTALAAPAFATIDNTVTVTATVPGGGTINPTATETVDVQNAVPGVSIVKAIAFANPGDDVDGDGKADAGDTLSYSYIVTNNGNVSLNGVGVADAHDGAGAALSIAVPTAVTTDNGSAGAGTLNDSSDANTTDSLWDKLGPGDVITFTSSYAVVAADLAANGGGTGTSFIGVAEPDGYLDNTADASASFGTGGAAVTVTASDTRSIQLDVSPDLVITKVADDTTNVTAGQVITYTYTVTNNGNVPIANVTLSDTHKGVLDALVPAFQSFTVDTGSTNTGNTIDILQPGDVAVFTATYTVTQSDVDTLQ